MFLVFAVCIVLAVAKGEKPVPIDIFSMYLLSFIAAFIYRESHHQPDEDKDDYGW
jgi:hypothetical protein